MTEARRCGSCGSELPPEASPHGLCARCLLEAGLETSQATSDSRQETSPGAPPSADPGPLDAAELSRLFPQIEIQTLLGRGGMGAVYLARQKALDRPVALKLLAPRGGTDAEFAERFGREARTLARLNHPNIVAIYDFGAVGGLYYFLMEYVPGTSLREVMRQGQLSPRQALALVPQICDALQYAHDECVVHRDIKPENILLDKKGRIKIADFGLAKILGQDASGEALTGSRHVMGTPHYMAPEQLEHPKAVDHRADIYSLGVVLYEMLTGELPLGRFAPPSQKVHVDVRLDEVVLRALEKEPERRYQHVSDIKSDIGEIPSPDTQPRTASLQRPEETRPADPELRRTRWRLAAAALSLGAFAIWLLEETGDPIYLAWYVVLVDLFFQRWLGHTYASPELRRRRQPQLLVPLILMVVFFFFQWMSSLPGTSSLLSSFLRSAGSTTGIWIGMTIYLIIYGGVLTLSSESREKRIHGVLWFQTGLMILVLFPAIQPLKYFSWIYRLSGTKPGASDSLVLRLLFAAALAALLAWKIQTWRALTRRPAKEGRLEDSFQENLEALLHRKLW